MFITLEVTDSQSTPSSSPQTLSLRNHRLQKEKIDFLVYLSESLCNRQSRLCVTIERSQKTSQLNNSVSINIF